MYYLRNVSKVYEETKTQSSPAPWSEEVTRKRLRRFHYPITDVPSRDTESRLKEGHRVFDLELHYRFLP